jgi:hypothetical protein
MERSVVAVGLELGMKVHLVYVIDFHGYLCDICGIFRSKELAQEYINKNQLKVRYSAETTARFFEVKELSLGDE